MYCKSAERISWHQHYMIITSVIGTHIGRRARQEEGADGNIKEKKDRWWNVGLKQTVASNQHPLPPPPSIPPPPPACWTWLGHIAHTRSCTDQGVASQGYRLQCMGDEVKHPVQDIFSGLMYTTHRKQLIL
jgi:hypothetical protein